MSPYSSCCRRCCVNTATTATSAAAAAAAAAAASRRRRLTLIVLARIGLLLTICLIFGGLHLFGKPFPRRFFCTDQSIRYPVPSGSTVPYLACAPLGVALATIAIVWFEVLRPPASSSSSSRGGGVTVSLRRQQVRRRRWSNCLLWLYYFCLGCAANELLTISAKLALGRHRPYFIAACRPDIQDILDDRTCNSSVAYPVSICRPTMSHYEFKDAQMSFPSGHTSYSLFVVVFLAGYLQMKLRGCPAARFSLQLCLILVGLCVGYSRVSDYKHHWSDVLAGVALGAAVAVAALHTAAAVAEAAARRGQSGSSACNGLAGAPDCGFNAVSATSIGDDVEIQCEDDEDDDLVASGPPRRRRLRDQAAIDAEESAAVATVTDEADRDSGNVEDETKSAAASRSTAAVNSNGVV